MGMEEDEVRALTKEYFGQEMSRDDVADLSGVLRGGTSTVRIGVQRRYEGSDGEAQVGLIVTTTLKDSEGREVGFQSRVINRDEIYNSEFRVNSNYRGADPMPTSFGPHLGFQSFRSQIDAATKFGYKRITNHAVGSGTNQEGQDTTGSNGFYTWARFGFEGEVMGPQGVVKVSSLMTTPAGRTWWRTNGEAFEGTFDLNPNSLSMRVFSEYRRLKEVRR
jgi:hypothetical protein